MSFQFKSYAETGGVIHGHNDTDKAGNPAGGHAIDCMIGGAGYGISINLLNPEQPVAYGIPRFFIRWQKGPLNREDGSQPNGAFVEDVLEVCRRRLEFYQDSQFAHESNEKAMNKIQEAIDELMARREDRKARGVLGKNVK